MAIAPDFDQFVAEYDAGRPQLVWTRLIADLETPVSAFMKLADGLPNSFLLESVEGGKLRGRYSIIGLKPDLIWRCKNDRAVINRRARATPGDPAAFEPCPVGEANGALASLRALLAECEVAIPKALPPMACGLFGYLGYDMVRQMERLPDSNPDPLDVADAILLRPSIVAVFDSVEDLVTIVTPVWPADGLSAERAYTLARERLADVMTDLRRSLPNRREPRAALDGKIEPVSNLDPAGYRAMVEKAKEYIRAGDIFQVVPSQRFRFPFKLPALSLYRSLRRLNPSPFLFFFDFDDLSLVGSSPEIMVRHRDGVVTIRPLAGTRRRGATPAEDRALSADLLADPKELAEHLMLLDLSRNDVGRVAEIGSVEVTEREVIEYYSHVMHIVSNVEGRLRADKTALDALIAGFPVGTVTGAPKVRAMEIIDELESERRGVYAGAVGYFGADGAMDTCIALRTAVLKDGTCYVQAGGGVVADSDPQAEYEESCNKARALMRAAEDALSFAADGF
ncbi:MAG: anthranilate synthase component I [Alphaproteobacteria bacterium]